MAPLFLVLPFQENVNVSCKRGEIEGSYGSSLSSYGVLFLGARFAWIWNTNINVSTNFSVFLCMDKI